MGGPRATPAHPNLLLHYGTLIPSFSNSSLDKKYMPNSLCKIKLGQKKSGIKGIPLINTHNYTSRHIIRLHSEFTFV
jgi:hypothetical protein